MKKILLSVFAIAAISSSAQTSVFSENFDVFATLATNGWTQTNQSSPVGPSTWAQGGGTAFATGGFNGGPTSFSLVNFNSTTGAGTISNWLITPVITIENGDVISFYTRQGGLAPSFPDRLQVRLSTNGAASANPVGDVFVGDYTTLIAEVNPDLALAGYPLTWTQFTYTVTGLTGPTASKIGFRYFVTDAGPNGNNSNIIGIDAFSIDRPLATDTFFKSNFAMYPNPAKNVLNISGNAGLSMDNVVITDLNGRVVKQQNLGGVASSEINVADLTSGMYLITISNAEGKGTSKFMKN